MGSKINISIPTPCHENWQDMTVADKGRFCASCQKNVIDFTQSSDRQIAETFKKEGNVCGLFLKSQLERDLVVPKEKNRLWMAASAAVVAFLGLGNGKVFAQDATVKTVQVENNTTTNTAIITPRSLITGKVTINKGDTFPGVIVKNITTGKQSETDYDGVFFIEAEKGNIIEFTFVPLKIQTIKIDDPKERLDIILEEPELLGEVVYIRDRTFFGRVFQNIGKIF